MRAMLLVVATVTLALCVLKGDGECRVLARGGAAAVRLAAVCEMRTRGYFGLNF